jgi:hypothetical protein
MRRASPVAGLLVACGCLVLAQKPFQRDKVMVTAGRHEYLPLENPRFIPAAHASYLSEDDVVLGLSFAGENRAYPLRLMNWHHIVNDVVGQRPVTVTF